MILFNKLVRMDLLLLLAVIALFVIGASKWRDALVGFTLALLLISLASHFKHYKTYKKFY